MDHVADLPVELQQLGADQAEVLAGANQRDGACLAQRLVAEVDVEQRLDLALRAATEHSAGPLSPGGEIKGKCEKSGPPNMWECQEFVHKSLMDVSN